MTEQHSINPPPELVQQWVDEANEYIEQEEYAFANRAAQWGADKELEACCEWMDRNDWSRDDIDELHSARRPKPPSLKQQAIAELDDAVMRGDCITVSDALPTIRRALEALPDNE